MSATGGRPSSWIVPTPGRVMVAVSGTAVLSWALFLYLDVRDGTGMIAAALESGGQARLFYRHWFGNGGPVELVQWVVLGGASVFYARAGGVFRPGDPRRSFALLMAFLLVLMLIEDAGDPRHTIRDYVQALAGEGDYGFIGTLAELLYFLLLGGFALFILGRHWRFIGADRRFAVYLAGACLCYGLAVVLSFSGSAFYGVFDQALYFVWGEALVRLLAPLSAASFQTAVLENPGKVFYLMDALVEESLELLGAGAFLASALQLATHDGG